MDEKPSDYKYQCRECGQWLKSWETRGAPDGPLRGPLCFRCFKRLRGPLSVRVRKDRHKEWGYIASKVQD